MRATALGTESFYFVSHLFFKAFKDTHLHNSRIMNMSRVSHTAGGEPLFIKQTKKKQTYSYTKMIKYNIYFYFNF